MCKDNDKLRLLEEQLNDAVEDARVIVFVNTKTHCDTVSRHLDHLGYRCTVLHGGKTQARAAPRTPTWQPAFLSVQPARASCRPSKVGGVLPVGVLCARDCMSPCRTSATWGPGGYPRGQVRSNVLVAPG